MNKFYVLEVIRFITEEYGKNGWLNKGSKFEHVDYMKVKFKAKLFKSKPVQHRWLDLATFQRP